MRIPIIMLALAACGCSRPTQQADANVSAESAARNEHSSRDARSEFLQLTGNDNWAAWPVDLLEDPYDRGRACIRVTEPLRETAVALLEQEPAVQLSDAQYLRLIGTARPPGGGSPYLLRAFSAANSTARVRWAGDAVVVHTDTPGSLSNVRRHPCVSILIRRPAKVFTVAAQDL